MEFKMLTFKVQRGEVHSKTFESFDLPSKFLFLKSFKSIHKPKTVHKVVLIIFEIILKIN